MDKVVAELHKLIESRASPNPRRTYTMRTIRGVPKTIKQFSIAEAYLPLGLLSVKSWDRVTQLAVVLDAIQVKPPKQCSKHLCAELQGNPAG